MAYDAHKNFAISLIAVAPIPAASGTTFSVTAGEGALFPAAPFNCPVWPAGANPSTTNAEIVRVTSKGTGDNWTVTRTQEASSARAIALGDQVANAITVKVLTDIEAAQTTDATNIATGVSTVAALDTRVVLNTQARVPGGRLTLTTALPVTVADVTAATTLYYTPYTSNIIALYNGTAWVDYTFPELSIAVPATTNTMYDVWVYDNAGTRTLELLAWTNDTTRATAIVRQDGHWVKTGATTRLLVGSFRTTAVSGQTEDSAAKRLVSNAFNRVKRTLRCADVNNTWNYTTATLRQVNAAVTNQFAAVFCLAETPLEVIARSAFSNSSTLVTATTGIGEDSTSVNATGVLISGASSALAAAIVNVSAELRKYPTVGYHFYAWLEYSVATGTTSWLGVNSVTVASGMHGTIDG